MARTIVETEKEQHVVTEADAKGLPAMLDEANQLTIAQTSALNVMDAFKALGRIEASQFYATVAEKLIVETALSVREGKKYKGLPYKMENGECATVATFEEFCEVFLGKSARRVQELISNYNTLGPDLYEQAERLGFRQRDYNALKALPADDRQLIAQAIEEENLDKALDLMQEMAAKHLREKETLGKRLDDLNKENQSKDDVIKTKIEANNKKDDEILALERKLADLRRDQPIHAHIDFPAAFQGYIDQAAATRRQLEAGLGALEVIRAEAMQIQPESDAEEASLSMAREILAKQLIGIHNDCLEMLQALGMRFDQTLGMYADERLAMMQQAIGE